MGAHRLLHSFPTRRSSDLKEVYTGDAASLDVNGIVGYRVNHNLDVHLEIVVDAVAYDPRSEEHTSELQSRVDLVCRLLLEKKNTVRSDIVAFIPSTYRTAG